MGNKEIQVNQYEVLGPERKNLCEVAEGLFEIRAPTSKKFKEVLSGFQISRETMGEVVQKLEKSKGRDKKESEKKYQDDLAVYKTQFKENPFWKKGLLRISGTYKENLPEVPKIISERTKLLEEMVEIGNLIEEGLTARKIPELLEKNQEKYSQLERTIQKNSELISQTKKNFELLPQKIGEYKSFIDKIELCGFLSKEEKSNIENILRENDYSPEVILNLGNKEERTGVLTSAKIVFDELTNAHNSARGEIETLEYGILRSREQIEIIEKGFEQIKATFIPGIRELYKLYKTFSELETFYELYEISDSAATVLLEGPKKRIKAEEVIRHARKVLEVKSLDAIAYSGAHEEYKKLSAELGLEEF
jgi:hypothetical protein